MKYTRFFYIIVAFWLSFTGIALAKATPIFEKPCKERTAVKTTLADVKYMGAKWASTRFIHKKHSSTRWRSFVRNGMKRKATPFENTALPQQYQGELLVTRCLLDRPAYGVSVQYHVALHTYLHLYQLF